MLCRLQRKKRAILALYFFFAVFFLVVEIRIRTINKNTGPILNPVREEAKLRRIIVEKAISYLSTPYGLGGNEKNSGLDCSGLTQSVYQAIGFQLPHDAKAQYQLLKKTNTPKEGDLVFFRRGQLPIGHVGVFVSQNLFIHAPSQGKQVRYERMDHVYYKKNYVGAASIFP